MPLPSRRGMMLTALDAARKLELMNSALERQYDEEQVGAKSEGERPASVHSLLIT